MEGKRFVNDPTQDAAVGAAMKEHKAAQREANRINDGKVLPLCFATTNGADCRVLKDSKCCGAENCLFYKSAADAGESRNAANRRIASLDYSFQLGIAEKYYDGKMPWKE